MKGLSLWQPWATLVAIGAKRVETRSWSTSYRGPVAIHAGARRGGLALCEKEPFRSALVAAGVPTYRRYGRDLLVHSALPFGAIVAVAEIWDCRYIDGIPRLNWMPTDPRELAFGDYSLGRWMWFLCNVRALREPVVCSGAQGLRGLDVMVEKRVREQLEATDAG